MSLAATEQSLPAPSPAARAVRTARGAGASALRAARAVLSPAGLRGVAVEGTWTAAHVATYPLGLLTRGRRDDSPSTTYAVGHLPPVQRGLLVGDVEAAGTPILLVHGMVDNRSVFTVLRRGLRRRGFGRVHTINYSPLTSDVRRAARDLAHQVEELTADTGYERIHVVGHSLGGLIARYYVQRLGGDERVHTLVTLGTPHAGTQPARLLPTTLCRQLRPGSDLLAELAEPSRGCRTRFVAYWTDLDHMVVPQRAGRLDHPDLLVRNELVRGVGHLSLSIDPRVVHGICTELAQLDPDGRTTTAGVAPLRPRRS